MPDNERLCALAQAGDAAARDLLLERNMGFVRKTALELHRQAGESGLDGSRTWCRKAASGC